MRERPREASARAHAHEHPGGRVGDLLRLLLLHGQPRNVDDHLNEVGEQPDAEREELRQLFGVRAGASGAGLAARLAAGAGRARGSTAVRA